MSRHFTAAGNTRCVYDAGRSRRTELDAREACLRAVVIDAAANSAHMLVLEQDDSLLWWDQQRLIEITREVGCRNTLRYEHRRAREELLLAIPDAVAWCWARGESGASESSPWSPSGTASDPGQREARLTNRPDGYRAHFLKLNATGCHQA